LQIQNTVDILQGSSIQGLGVQIKWFFQLT